jgi:3-ketosteroid 9alpha-monooxygenase subunit A
MNQPALMSVEDEPLDDNFPFSGYPTGWFQVGWRQELEVGAALPLRYFGIDLVMYRDAAGSPHILDAHCPHLGAHLGYGGTVDGDCVVCPFHGWQWSPDGSNASIPNRDRPHQGVKLRSWPVRELGELIFVWHDALDRPPSWEPPAIPEFDDPDRYRPYPDLVHYWHKLRLRPQYVGENVVDAPHQQWVHRSPSPSTLVSFEPDGPIYRSKQEFTVGAGREKTWLTPDGPMEASLMGESWGVGVNLARYSGTDESLHVHCHTPIDERHVDERLTVLAAREPGEPDKPGKLTMRRFDFERYQFERDVKIWEHLRYIKRPPFTPDEARPYSSYRKWVSQFYLEADAQATP